MGRKAKSWVFGGSVVLLFTGNADITPARAGSSATASAKVTATVLRNIAITGTSNLSFGNLATSMSPGSIMLDQGGKRHATGGTRLEAGGFHAPAVFRVTGEPKSSFFVELPRSITLSDHNGHTMQVRDFAVSTGNVTSFDAAGMRKLKVGATLDVNPNQAIGDYEGVMNVSVHYN
jgi:hypothetical protein